MYFAPETEFFIAILSIVLFATIAYSTKIISKSGIIFGALAGLVALFLGGFAHFIALLVFYAAGEIATRTRGKSKQLHEQRNKDNIIGNCSVAIFALLAGAITSTAFPGTTGIFTMAFFGAISAALADTLSSEIGMLSGKDPVLITTFKRVEKGTDGGITSLGTFASIIGAIIIGLIYFFSINNSVFEFGAIIVAGVFGSAVDSLVGATFERKGKLNNTQVNMITTFAGAVAAVALMAIAAI